MNKSIAISVFISVVSLLIGCGSSSSKSEDTRANTSSFNPEKAKDFDGYILQEYLFPTRDQVVPIYKYLNKEFYKEEKLSYKISQDSNYQIVKLQSLSNIGGYVEYYLGKENDSAVNINIYQDEDQKAFKLENFIHIGDSVTLKSGECKVAKHYQTLKLPYDTHSFNDVLEIDCPKSVGYYQKHKGLVLQNRIESIEDNNLHFLPDFGKREIVNVDKSGNRFSVLNLDSAIEAKVDKLWRYPYNLTGQGMNIGLVDGGRVLENHVELKGRVRNLSNSNYSKHATHTAGTLISKGVHLPSSRGFVKDAKIYVLDYQESYFADAVKELLDYGVLISNHSYGFEGPQGLGEYDEDSYEFDKVISQNPYIIAVVAAGNDGKKYKKDRDFTKWFLIKSGANAKNVITVGAVDDDSEQIAEFSSRGPIRGGRLKPDISLDGYNVLSTTVNLSDLDDDTAYHRMYGTSMAAPAVTGAITLLAQRYHQINGANPRVDTIKAIIFNTAKDIENPGPDYKSGFGQLDAYKAVKVIDSMQQKDNSLVKLDSLIQNEHLSYTFEPKTYKRFKATVAWIDEAKEYSDLVDDIDIYLEDEFGNRVYPYTLDEFHPNLDAIKSKANHTDPQEQIETVLKPGVKYTLHIIGTKILGSKDFTIVSSTPLPKPDTNMNVAPMRVQIHDIYESISKD